MNALVAGQVDYMCADIITGGAHHEAGKIKVYAIATPVRNPALPNVPTTVEAGLPEFQVSAWNGLFAPKATPKPIVDRLADALDKALDDETTRKRMLVLGCDIPDKSQARPCAVPRAGQERDRALVADHQGGQRQDELAHDPGKWLPVFGQDHAQTKECQTRSDSIEADRGLERMNLTLERNCNEMESPHTPLDSRASGNPVLGPRFRGGLIGARGALRASSRIVLRCIPWAPLPPATVARSPLSERDERGARRTPRFNLNASCFRADCDDIDPISVVIAGLDPAIHRSARLLRRRWNPRVKPGGDECARWTG